MYSCAKLLHWTWKISLLTCELPPSSHWGPNVDIRCSWYLKCPKCLCFCCSCGKKSSAAAKWSLWISPRFREGEACERGCQAPGPHPWRGDRLGQSWGSARCVRRPLCAASPPGGSQERGLLWGHSFSSVSLLPPLHPWVGSAWRAQMEEFLSLHSGC